MTTESIFNPVDETYTEGRTPEIFAEIRRTLGSNRVPLIFRIIARLPLYLETSWQRYRFAYVLEGKLGRRTKLMLALAISASNNNRPMILETTEALKKEGVTDVEIAELMAVVDVTNGLNKTLKAAQVGYGD